MSRHRILALCLVASIAAQVLPSAAMAEKVFVWLANGRVLSGEVDAGTNDDDLRLRASSPNFVIINTIDWKQIQAVSVAGNRLTPSDFREQIDQFKSELPADHWAHSDSTELGNQIAVAGPEDATRNAARKVATLEVYAYVANWDRDAETDGLEIRVVPRDVFGEIVPVTGQLLTKLIGRHRVPVYDRNAFPEIGRWSLRTKKTDFGLQGAIFHLPYRRTHPEIDRSVEPHGLLETRLFVFGQGSFESDATVHLYTFNPIRRDLQRKRYERDR